jgi:hypothetical protein
LKEVRLEDLEEVILEKNLDEHMGRAEYVKIPVLHVNDH